MVREFESHDWLRESELYRQLEAKGKERCPAGLRLVRKDGQILHICAGLGNISGGGSQLDEPYPDGRARVKYCGIDIDVTDRDQGRALLMKKLVELAAPDGTELHYTKDGSMQLDRLDNGAWRLGEPRTFEHPGFGG
jgi:hypothetical protein